MYSLIIRNPPKSTPFPTRRSSDLAMRKQSTVDIAIGFSRKTCFPAAKAARASSACVLCVVAMETMCTARSEEHTSELQSLAYLVCRLLLEKKKENHKQ